tara:strand:- start:135 stop:734 length:600 start_codon:yes stop_codon:yes gene_type:complete
MSVFAHPVTFKDGTAITSIHRPKMTMVQVNHTIHRNIALAASYMRMEQDTRIVNVPSLHINTLIKRWNQIGSQANIYAMTGVGFDISDNISSESVRGMVGVQGDFETQKIYTAFTASALPSFVDISDIPFTARYRFGVAPYIAKYDELQIWVVGQVDYMSDMTEQPYFTPMLRYFYRTVLWETGVSLNGTYWFQMMAHF